MLELLKQPRVACVLVTWNNREHTERCLRSLKEQVYDDLLIIVVDNGSTDGSVAQLRLQQPDVCFIENGYNLGFAKACNIGALRGLELGAEFLWFLNNDTVAPPDTAWKLVRKASTSSKLGIVGAVLFYVHDPERVQAWGGGVISPWSGFNRHFVTPSVFGKSGYITFASALVRRETFAELRGLWEGVFLYYEDSDFSLRATRSGWALGVAEETAILHAENGSAASRRGRSPLMERIRTASGMRFLQRHGIVPPVAIVVFLCLRIGKRIAMRDWSALKGVIEGVGDWWSGQLTPFREDA